MYIFYNRLFLLVSCILICCSSMAQSKAKKQQSPVEIQKIDVVGTLVVVMQKSPVIILHDTLFNVYGNIGSFTSWQRAKSIQEKIDYLVDDPHFQADSIRFEDTGSYLNLMYQKQILMSVDSLQAAQENKSRIEAAVAYKQKIVETVEMQKHNTSWEQIALQVGGAIAIIIAEYFVIKYSYYWYRLLRVHIRKQRGKTIKGIFGIIDDQRAVLTAFTIINILRIFFVLIVLYLGLLILFKLFPYTKDLSDALLDYVLTPLDKVGKNIKAYMPSLFTILVIIFIFNYLRKVLKSFAYRIALKKISIKGFYSHWAFPTYNLISGVLFIFMFIFVFPYLPNSDSQIFQGVSVFAGIMLCLGSTSVVGNLVAGLLITDMRPFKLGDRIRLGEFTGDVLEKTALVTRIKHQKMK